MESRDGTAHTDPAAESRPDFGGNHRRRRRCSSASSAPASRPSPSTRPPRRPPMRPNGPATARTGSAGNRAQSGAGYVSPHDKIVLKAAKDGRSATARCIRIPETHRTDQDDPWQIAAGRSSSGAARWSTFPPPPIPVVPSDITAEIMPEDVVVGVQQVAGPAEPSIGPRGAGHGAAELDAAGQPFGRSRMTLCGSFSSSMPL